jgi:hypothetical protein
MKTVIIPTLLVLAILTGASHAESGREKVLPFPEVPRISAFEAYQNFKNSKVILLQAGGEGYEKRHIVGSLQIPLGRIKKGEVRLPNFPRAGVEIYTYCY